jgi:leucyl aminopeptidase (aminopeptidase T)
MYLFNDLLLKYAKLAVTKGVHIQKDGLLVINAPIECNYFARMIANEAYKAGASDVIINYSDENASCHLALGSSYPCCIKNGEKMTKDELKLTGANVSITHVDFMIGTKDTTIIGIKSTGEKVEIFRDCNWV